MNGLCYRRGQGMKFLMSLSAFCLRAASCKSICSSQLTDLHLVWMLFWAFCKVSWTNSPIKLSSKGMWLRFAACCTVVCTVTFLADVEASMMEDEVLDLFGLLCCMILREDKCLEMWWSSSRISITSMMLVLCGFLLNVLILETPPFWWPDFSDGLLESVLVRFEEVVVPREEWGEVISLELAWCRQMWSTPLWETKMQI